MSSDIEGLSIALTADPLDPTPSWTRIDDPDNGTAVQQVTIDRGRQTELDKVGTGTCTVQIIDPVGLFDPTNPSSPYYGLINPDLQAGFAMIDPVAMGGYKTLFRGFLQDPVYELDESVGWMMLTLTIVDAFDLLGRAEIMPDNAGDTVPTESVGDVYYNPANVDDRIRAGLADAHWPSALTRINSGNVTVQGTVYAPQTTILTVLQDAADAEFPGIGNVFVDKTGVFCFNGRYARFNPADASYDISHWRCGDISSCLGDDRLAPIAGASPLSFTRGKVLNSSLCYPMGIADADVAAQLVVDAPGILVRGIRSINYENLITSGGIGSGFDANDETQRFGVYYVSNYSDPRTRVTAVRFVTRPLDSLNAAALWQFLTGVDFGDLLDIDVSLPGGGLIDETFFVEGIHYTIKPGPDPLVPLITLALDVSSEAYFDDNPWE